MRSADSNARRNARTPGFTLIEVLVVTAIVTTIAALTLPSLRAAKERAHQAACMSNLHQIGIAMSTYGSDFGVYPYGIYSMAWYEDPAGQFWNTDLAPYLGRPRISAPTGGDLMNNRSPVIQCPSRAYKTSPDMPGNTNSAVVNTYGCNSAIFWEQASPNHVYSSRLTPGLVIKIPQTPFPWTERPSEVMMMADTSQAPNSYYGVVSEGTPIIYNPPMWPLAAPSVVRRYNPATANNPITISANGDGYANESCMRFRHMFNGQANFLFMDGHVASMKMNEIRERHLYVTPYW